MKTLILMAAAAGTFALGATAANAAQLDNIKSKGFVQCGVTGGVAGFSAPDASNNWTGIEVDYCKAMASALFGDPAKVRYTPLTSTERFAALSSGQVDVLSRTTTWTMGRDTTLGIAFVGTLFYDGQGFMVKKADNIASAKDLSGAAICIESGTTTELNAADYFATNKLDYKPIVFVSQDETVKAFEDGRCDVYTTDSSALAAERSKFAKPEDFVILPEIISKEPLGPAVRAGDDAYFKFARWVYFAMLNAEELGVTKANVEEMKKSDNPEIKRLLGVEGDFGTPLGLDKEWAYKIIKNVGNYGESYEAHVGTKTPIGLARGLNALWKDGGIQYAPPIR